MTSPATCRRGTQRPLGKHFFPSTHRPCICFQMNSTCFWRINLDAFILIILNCKCMVIHKYGIASSCSKERHPHPFSKMQIGPGHLCDLKTSYALPDLEPQCLMLSLTAYAAFPWPGSSPLQPANASPVLMCLPRPDEGDSPTCAFSLCWDFLSFSFTPPHPPQAIDGQSQRSQIPFHIPLAQLPSTVLSVIGDWPTSLTRCILGGHDAFWVGTACGNSCLSSENEEWFILQSLYMIHVYISHTYIYVCVYLLCIHLLYVDVFLSFPEPKILIIFKNIFTDWFTPVLISISFPEAILLRSSEKS